MAEQQTQRRATPQNELDFVLMTTDSVWGRPDVSNELKQILSRRFLEVDDEGKAGYTYKSLWGLLGYYSRDMRLSNLSTISGEFEYCKYYIDLAGDCLQEGLVKPFLIALSRAATILELSQSKGGFLRRKMGTIRHEQISEEVPKKKLFGGKANKEGY